MRGKGSVAIKSTTSPSFPEGPWLGTGFPPPGPLRADSCMLNKIPLSPLVSLQYPLLPHPLLIFLIFKGVLWSCRQRSLTKTKVSLAVESGKNKLGSSIQYYTCLFVCFWHALFHDTEVDYNSLPQKTLKHTQHILSPSLSCSLPTPAMYVRTRVHLEHNRYSIHNIYVLNKLYMHIILFPQRSMGQGGN